MLPPEPFSRGAFSIELALLPGKLAFSDEKDPLSPAPLLPLKPSAPTLVRSPRVHAMRLKKPLLEFRSRPERSCSMSPAPLPGCAPPPTPPRPNHVMGFHLDCPCVKLSSISSSSRR
eukprot:323594-Chlamydomonas_euryale.AAC.2